jgi:hypothetical protein
MRTQHAVVMGVIALALVAAGYGRAIPEYRSTGEEGGHG